MWGLGFVILLGIVAIVLAVVALVQARNNGGSRGGRGRRGVTGWEGPAGSAGVAGGTGYVFYPTGLQLAMNGVPDDGYQLALVLNSWATLVGKVASFGVFVQVVGNGLITPADQLTMTLPAPFVAPSAPLAITGTLNVSQSLPLPPSQVVKILGFSYGAGMVQVTYQLSASVFLNDIYSIFWTITYADAI
jgi:hypothetical protein